MLPPPVDAVENSVHASKACLRERAIVANQPLAVSQHLHHAVSQHQPLAVMLPLPVDAVENSVHASKACLRERAIAANQPLAVSQHLLLAAMQHQAADAADSACWTVCVASVQLEAADAMTFVATLVAAIAAAEES
jgi:hypothetical protein